MTEVGCHLVSRFRLWNTCIQNVLHIDANTFVQAVAELLILVLLLLSVSYRVKLLYKSNLPLMCVHINVCLIFSFKNVCKRYVCDVQGQTIKAFLCVLSQVLSYTL